MVSVTEATVSITLEIVSSIDDRREWFLRLEVLSEEELKILGSILSKCLVTNSAGSPTMRFIIDAKIRPVSEPSQELVERCRMKGFRPHYTHGPNVISFQYHGLNTTDFLKTLYITVPTMKQILESFEDSTEQVS